LSNLTRFAKALHPLLEKGEGILRITAYLPRDEAGRGYSSGPFTALRGGTADALKILLDKFGVMCYDCSTSK